MWKIAAVLAQRYRNYGYVSVRVRLNNQSWVLNIDSEGQFNNVPPELNDMCRIISHVHQHHHYLLGRVEV
ncbi:hypothetical protein EIMP300_27320 [Escherichia coli]|uniref:Uncharacterized protein n=1 Tax=Escherichia coli TaxID=562 RepID=A0A8S0FM90_ECOLX|nr:hypothetical protein EIMP300_27320 [Escherichia coli]